MKPITKAHKIEALEAGAAALLEDVEYIADQVLKVKAEGKKKSRYDSSGGPDLTPDSRMKVQAKHDLLVVCREVMLEAVKKMKGEPQ